MNNDWTTPAETSTLQAEWIRHEECNLFLERYLIWLLIFFVDKCFIPQQKAGLCIVA